MPGRPLTPERCAALAAYLEAMAEHQRALAVEYERNAANWRAMERTLRTARDGEGPHPAER